MNEPTPAPPPGREANGRFGAGNAGGPGRPKGRTDELQRAAQDAVTPEHVSALMRVALKAGLQGNLQAVRLVLDRVCGKVPDPPAVAAALDIHLPALRTATDCAAAIDKLAAAVSAGTIDLASIKVLTDLVHARMKSIELNDYEVRLAELEKQVATVDVGGSGARR